MNWQHLSRIYHSALQERRTLGSFGLLWLLLVLTFVLPMLPLIFSIRLARPVALLSFSGMLFALLMSTLPQLIINGLRLATPHFNQTVPGLTRALYQAFGLTLLTSTLVLAFLTSLATGHFLLYALGISSTLLLISFLCLPGNAKFSLPLGLFGIGSALTWLPGFVADSGLWDNRPLPTISAVALVLLLFHLLASRMFGVRGERAYAINQKLNGLTELITGKTSKTSTLNWSKVMGAAYLYDASLAHAVQQPTNKPRLLMYGLGYGLHWSMIVANLSWMILLGTLVAVPFFLSNGNPMFGLRIMTLSAFMAVFGLPMGILRHGYQALAQHRPEQQLLKLLPAGVSAHGYNRLFALSLLRQFGFTLAAALALDALVLLLIWQCAADPQAFGFERLPGLLVATLPLVLATLDNYAGTLHSYRNTWLFYLVAVLLAVVFGAINSMHPPLPLFYWLSAIVILATLLAFKQRWNKTMAAPVAMPSGRLAKQ